MLKDIKNALLTKSVDSKSIENLVKSEIKTALPNAMDKMLRKMGYSVSKPDVTKFDVESKFGLDEVDVKKSEEKPQDDPTKVVEEMSKMSFTKLAQLREQAGGFKLF